MGAEALVTRLNDGRTTKPFEGGGSKYAPRLTDEEIKVAAGLINDSFDHALLLALHGAGLNGYHRSEQNGRPVGFKMVTFDSLLSGARQIAWEIRNHKKRNVNKFSSNIIATFALEALFEGQARSEVELSRVCGLHRSTWRNNYAHHYLDTVAELQARAKNAEEDLRIRLG